MSKITMNVEFLAGTDISEAIAEAKQKALQWDVAYVCFKFNGVSVSVSKKADLCDMREEIMAVMGSKRTFVVG